jgi:hypothetical protein
MEWIVDEPVIFVHQNGRRTPGRIAVGMPRWIDDFEARCAVALDGLEEIGIPACGSSPLQALVLGLQHLGYRLHDFQSRGGRVVYPDDNESMAIEAIFGALLRPVEAPEVNG